MQKTLTGLSTLALILVLISFLSTPALARSTASTSSAYIWTGFYMGINVGGSWADFDNDNGVVGPKGTGGGISGGLQGGYNWQFGHYVVGGEAEMTWLGIDATDSTIGSFDEDWQATIRARAGYTFGSFLPYITLGVAMTETDAKVNGSGGHSDTATGIAAGAGVDYKIDQSHWSGRLEYLYTDVPKERVTIGSTAFAGGSSNNTLRAAFNYHF